MPVFRAQGKAILFIHVPKSGGSTIERWFKRSGFETSYLDGRMGKSSVNHLRWCTPQHMHGAMLRAHFRLDRFDFIFMVVRDPVSRFRSEYVWRHRKGEEIPLAPNVVEKWTHQTLQAYRADPFVYDNHIRPQSDFHVPGTHIYHFEEGLEPIVTDINARLGLDVQTDEHRAKDAFQSYGIASGDVRLSTAVRARVQAFYRRDYLKFNYRLDGTGPRAYSLDGMRGRIKAAVAARALRWADPGE